MSSVVPEHLSAEQLRQEIPAAERESIGRDYLRLKNDFLDQYSLPDTTEAELRVVKQLLADAENGTFWLDGEKMGISPHAKVKSSSVAAIRSLVVGGGEDDPKKKALRTLALVVVLALVAFGANALLSNRGRKAPATPRPTVQGSPNAGLVQTRQGITVTVLPEVTPVDMDSLFDGVKMTVGLFYPKTLELGGVAFYLFPTSVSPTTPWEIPQDEGAAAWLRGTSINYSIGLPYTERNAALMNAQQPGDRVRVRMSTGVVLEFIVAETKRVRPQNVEVFRQKEPAITVVLTGDPAADRLVVIGYYDVTTEIVGGYNWGLLGITPFHVWERGYSGALAVDVVGVRHYTAADAIVQGIIPSGQVLYVLDIAAENLSGGNLALAETQVEAVDRNGIRYPSMVSLAKRFGDFAAFTDVATSILAPGEQTSFAVAYLVPEDFTAFLLFVVTAPDGQQIPFDLSLTGLEPTPTPLPTAAATVLPTVEWTAEITAAYVFTDVGGITPTNERFLALELRIGNSGTTPVQLTEADFTLTCAGTEDECAGTLGSYPLAASVTEFMGKAANLFPVTVVGSGQVTLLLVFDIEDVPAVKLVAAGREMVVTLK